VPVLLAFELLRKLESFSLNYKITILAVQFSSIC